MNTLNQMARIYNWQILHSNLNAIDMGGDPAPTFYACNQTATKFVSFCFTFFGNWLSFYSENILSSPVEAKIYKHEKT